MQITCPLCKKLSTWEENPFRPFCSERCRLVDFGAWVTEDYRISSKKEEEEDERQQDDYNK